MPYLKTKFWVIIVHQTASWSFDQPVEHLTNQLDIWLTQLVNWPSIGQQIDQLTDFYQQNHLNLVKMAQKST